MTPQAAIDSFYSAGVLISPGQAYAIGAAIAAAGPRPNVLVFGCGNDSPMWQAMNEAGRTVFVEDDAAWIEKTRRRFPDLEICRVSYGDTTVARSLPIRDEALAEVPIPEVLTDSAWDVILVDGPMGFRPQDTGRSLSIYWASRVMGDTAQVFVDDYERPLERLHANRFIRSKRLWNVELLRLFSDGRRSGTKPKMLWSIGVTSSLTAGLVPDFGRTRSPAAQSTVA